MEIKNLTGLEKPLVKLIEVIAQGCGTVTRSHFIKKTAEAKANEIRMIAQAAQDIGLPPGKFNYKNGELIISGERLQDEKHLRERTNSRLNYQEAQRQQNIEAITQIAAEQLAQENEVSEKDVDPDWINRFFNCAQNISNEEMQAIWGKILAGEIIGPGSFSMRTIDIIRNLSESEANIFKKVSSYVIQYKDSGYLPFILLKYPKFPMTRSFQPISSDSISRLKEAGLVIGIEKRAIRFFPYNGRGRKEFILGNNTLVVKTKKKEFVSSSFPAIGLTNAGSELITLTDQHQNMNLLIAFSKTLIDRSIIFKKFYKGLRGEFSMDEFDRHLMDVPKRYILEEMKNNL